MHPFPRTTTSCLDDPLLTNIAQSAGSNANYPSPMAINLAKAAIPRMQAEIQAIDWEIARLTRQQADIRTLGRNLSAARAPHKRLPNEILAYTFSFLADETGVTIPRLWEYGAWPLRSVCSLWRRLALEQHILWNTVSLQPNFDQNREAGMSTWQQQIMLANQILPRRGTVSISVSCSVIRHHMMDYALSNLVHPLANRIRRLKFDAGLQGYENFFIQHPPVNFPALTALDLSFSEAGREGNPSMAILSDNRTFFELTPSITSFSLLWDRHRGFQDFFDQKLQIGLPWAQLSQLDIGNTHEPIDLQRILVALQSTERLKSLSLRIQKASEFMLDGTVVHLPYIEKLCIKPLTHYILPLLDSLVLSHLQNLEIADTDAGLPTLSSLLRRSECTLLSFSEKTNFPEEFEEAYEDLLGNLKGLGHFNTNRFIGSRHLGEIASGKILPGCKYQKWRTSMHLSVSLLALAKGLDVLPRSGAEVAAQRSSNRVLALSQSRIQRNDTIQSADIALLDSFRRQFGLHVYYSYSFV